MTKEQHRPACPKCGNQIDDRSTYDVFRKKSFNSIGWEICNKCEQQLFVRRICRISYVTGLSNEDGSVTPDEKHHTEQAEIDHQKYDIE